MENQGPGAALTLCDARLRRRFLALPSQRLCDIEDHLAALGRQNAKGRMISFLLPLAARIGLDEDDLVDVPMNQQDIASLQPNGLPRGKRLRSIASSY